VKETGRIGEIQAFGKCWGASLQRKVRDPEAGKGNKPANP
jgi:hypothetical protein